MSNIAVPFTFSPNTTILSAQVNSNFTAFSTGALNKVGDTMSGTLVAQAITAAANATYDIGVTGTRFVNLWLSGTMTAATAAVTTVNATTVNTTNLAAYTLTGTVTAGANVIDQPELRRYLETTNAVSPGASPTFDLSTGNHFTVAMTANITGTVVFSNPAASGKATGFLVAFTQDATGSRTVAAWPASVKWPGGSAPTLTTTANKTDIFAFLTYNGGTSYYASTVGQNL